MSGFLAEFSRLLRNSPGPRRHSGRKLREIQSLELRSLLSADFQLVKDLNPNFEQDSSRPSEFVHIGSTLYFSAYTESGYGLWKSDGTVAGTKQIKSVYDPANLTNVGGTLFFTASDWTDDGTPIGEELWKSDGTEAGTVMVKDIRPNAGPDDLRGEEDSSSYPSNLTSFLGVLYFSANDGTNGNELWRSDGTPQGTFMVKDLFPGTHVREPRDPWGYLETVPNSSYPVDLVNMNGTLYFAASDGISGRELWKSNGTAEGTVLVKDIFRGTYKGEELVIDYTTRPIDIPHDSRPQNLVVMDGALYFSANDGTSGVELWKSNGSAEGTTLVRNIGNGAASGSPDKITAVGNTLYFTANDAIAGTELWKSDGTTSGTSIVKNIFAGSGSSNPENLTNVNGVLYFSASEALTGTELWKSNGTEAGTVLVKDIRGGAESSSPGYLVNVNGTLYFSGSDSTFGSELWKTDGTAPGTQIVKDIRPGNQSSEPRHLTNVNGTLYLAADNGTNGIELWKSNGTPAGTTLFNLAMEDGQDSEPGSFANVGGLLYFSANDGTNGAELWKSNGTASGTVMVRSIRGGSAGSDPLNLTAVGGTLFFTANDGSHGVELWKTDGTPSGTMMVRDIRVGSGSADPANLTNVGGTLYFTVNGEQLWKSDGTSAGTVQVKPIQGSASLAAPSHLVNVGGVLYFTAAYHQLWKSDGTSAGTVMVKAIDYEIRVKAEGGDGLLYFLTAGDNAQQLWKSNGTTSGTVLIKDSIGEETNYDGYSLYPSKDLISAGGSLYFTAYTDEHGEELWTSNGTSAGTRMVKDIDTGTHFEWMPGGEYIGGFPDNSSPASLTRFGDELYFVATDDAEGTQVWKSNGTAAGTVRISEFVRPLNRMAAGPLQFIGNKLYAGMTTEALGRELYVADLTQGTTGNDQYTLTYSGQGPQAKVLVTLSSNGGPVTNLGRFSTALPLTLNGLSGNDSVRIVGTAARDVVRVSASGVSFNGHQIVLTGIENRTLAGAAGDDEYRFDADAPLGLFTLDESAGGRDTLNFSETSTIGVNVNLGVATTQVINANLRLVLGSRSTFENVDGGAGNDVLTGNSLNNTLRGNGGHDRLSGVSGSDTLVGGDGNDNYVFAAALFGENNVVSETGTNGVDTLNFSSLTSDVSVNLGLTSATTFQRLDTKRFLRLTSGSGIENVFGGSGNDTITGNTLVNLLSGGAGHDRLAGVSGSDTLVGGNGNDTYVFQTAASGESNVISETGSNGVDTLNFSSLTSDVSVNLGLTSATTFQRLDTKRLLRLNPGSSIENVVGGSGNDTITGNAFVNNLNGGAGHDRLAGVSGSDTLVGGNGNDTYVFKTAVAGENNVVSETGTNGVDTLNFSSLTGDVSVNLGLTSATSFQRLDTKRFLRLTSGSNIENVSGGAGNDTITGNSLNNLLQGNLGNDILVGNSGNDRLLGGAGRDLLIGGLGRDSLDAGTEDDILIAGRTNNDNLIVSLHKVRTEWVSALPYVTRVTRLRAGVGSPVVSLKAKLNVLNDAGDDDSLTGGTGSDWYFRALDDAILGLTTGELIDLL